MAKLAGGGGDPIDDATVELSVTSDSVEVSASGNDADPVVAGIRNI